MDKFQVYNRSQNVWEDVELLPTWSENWVIDKTTDNGKVKLKYKGHIMPDWDNGDWCRLLHLADNETGATYTKHKILKDEKIITEDAIIKTFDGDSFNVYTESLIAEDVNVSLEVLVEYTNASSVQSSKYLTFSITLTEEERAFNKVITSEDIGESATNINITMMNFEEVFPGEVSIIDSYYFIPKNHEQYIIKNPIKVLDVVNDEIDIQLDLGEPIEMMQGVSCETMSHTNQISKIVDGIEYTHEALNHLSVLEKILKVTPANNNLQNSWYSRIKICDKNLLKNIPYNDETTSEPTIYSILLDKYDSSVGRTPVIYFDINGETDLPYNAIRTEYVLKFERQDGYDKEAVQYNDLIDGASEIINSKSFENFAQGVVSNYGNLDINRGVYAPAEEIWLIPEVDTNKRILTDYTDTGKGEWILRTPHAIKKINYVKMFKVEEKTAGIYAFGNIIQPIVHNVKDNFEILEEKQYVASQTDYEGTNAIWYTEGDNKIHLNNMYFKDIGNNNSNLNSFIYAYQVGYEPFVSGRFDLAKEYQLSVNQVDSQVDNYKFGKYLKEYLASMNKADITISKVVEDFADIKEVGVRVLNENNEYIITSVSIQNREFEYNVVYQLNENHIRRNDSIQAPQEIRKNIEIGVDATKERASMFNIDVGISADLESKQFYLNNVDFGGSDNIARFLAGAFSSSLNNQTFRAFYPQLAEIYFKSDKPFVSSGTNELLLQSEVVRFYINDTICFNIRYFDNAEAGKVKNFQKRDVSIGAGIYGNIDILGTPEYQIPMLYTDVFGEFKSFDIYFVNIDVNDISTLEVQDAGLSEVDAQPARKEYLNSVNEVLNIMANYPKADMSGFLPITSFYLENINYYKDMLDTFNYTFGIHYNTDNNIILCKGFFENSLFITIETKQKTHIKVYNKNMTENDISVETGRTIQITGINESSQQIDDIQITKVVYTLENEIGQGKSIVLFDEDDEPILIINNNTEAGNTFAIYHS